ncbi:hypothetical protein L1D29_07965 [Shewanella insulae]|uniref:hypothetical protein n=1 Tax=Shewanella insulae TaxID=2681496 RepID=UPI001EFD3DE0|nr:hypothetical protein [Shewanella insulae]MCG9712750.1 hypothetical protein [Shewanella insulae]
MGESVGESRLAPLADAIIVIQGVDEIDIGFQVFTKHSFYLPSIYNAVSIYDLRHQLFGLGQVVVLVFIRFVCICIDLIPAAGVFTNKACRFYLAASLSLGRRLILITLVLVSLSGGNPCLIS